MNILRKHYGLRWRGDFPPIPWADVLMIAQVIMILLLAYVAVAVIDQAETGKAETKAASALAMKYEAALVACLNGGAIAADRQMIACKTTEIIQ